MERDERGAIISRDYPACPECGTDMSTIDIVAHAEGHWPGHTADVQQAAALIGQGANPEAARRKALLLSMRGHV